MRVILDNLDATDGRAAEGGLVDGGDGRRDAHDVGIAASEGARANGGDGVDDAVVFDGLGNLKGHGLGSIPVLGVIGRFPLQRGRRRSCP